MAYVDRDRSRETALSGIAAAVMVGGIGFVVVTGLAMRVVHQPDAPLLVHEWAASTPPPPPPPAPNPSRSAHVRITVPAASVPTIVPPVSQEATITFPTTDRAIDAGSADVPTTPPPPPAVDHASRAVPRGDPGSWVTADDYPPSALRAGQEGRTGFRLDIGTDGRATACTVVSSSGSDALDQAACRMLMRRARFEPARDADGSPTTASYTSRVSWRLPAE